MKWAIEIGFSQTRQQLEQAALLLLRSHPPPPMVVMVNISESHWHLRIGTFALAAGSLFVSIKSGNALESDAPVIMSGFWLDKDKFVTCAAGDLGHLLDSRRYWHLRTGSRKTVHHRQARRCHLVMSGFWLDKNKFVTCAHGTR
jgi:hypothetical protein